MRKAAAADACHLSPLSDLSELPPDLAAGGCTGFASYQLGLGQKSARYAICPAVNGNCVNPANRVPLPCNAGVHRFVDAFKGDTSGDYSFAHTVTSVCDACLGSSVPEGMVVVAWHDRLHCPADAMVHDVAIEHATNVPAPAGSAGSPGKCSPQTTCLGGCMIDGPPPGI